MIRKKGKRTEIIYRNIIIRFLYNNNNKVGVRLYTGHVENKKKKVVGPTTTVTGKLLPSISATAYYFRLLFSAGARPGWNDAHQTCYLAKCIFCFSIKTSSPNTILFLKILFFTSQPTDFIWRIIKIK